MSNGSENLTLLANTIRMLSADAVQEANSGHPGLPLGAADIAAVLWSDFLRFHPDHPSWLGRDRFVLSAGHGSMLLYSLLHLFQYDLPLSELKNFRQWQSKTPGHPEFEHTAGVECTTGPLGQGFANGVGIALSEKLLAARYSNELFGNRVFGIVSDGDLMEGIASEAASLAGHLKLGNLVYLYDDNKISLADETKVCFSEDVAARFQSYGWHVASIDGHDLAAIQKALADGIDEKERPTLICCRTVIGKGSPNKAGTADVHGAPLGDAELALTKEYYGWPVEPRFHIPAAVTQYCAEQVAQKKAMYEQWQKSYQAWQEQHREKAILLQAQLTRTVPEALKDELLEKLSSSKPVATRNLSGTAIQTIAEHLPGFIGGSADLEPSNKTLIKSSGDISSSDFTTKNIRFGVREHAMGAIVNGLAYQQCWVPFGATFLVFSDYLRPAIRLAALSHLQSLFIFTHDSFWVGEDGPTHEPIEHIAALRLIPNLYVFRPADGVEVAMSYFGALQMHDRPSALLFTRQDLPTIERGSDFQADDVLRGAYVISNPDVSDCVIVATGSEVWLALEVAKLLEAEGKHLRVVSMPCVELFLELSPSEREEIVPRSAKCISLEAGVTAGWERIIGTDGLAIGINHYGASAPGELLAERFGFTAELVKNRVQAFLVNGQ